MNWHRTISDLPSDEEEVLIRWNGIVSLATFSEKSRDFITNTGAVVNFSTPGLQWLTLGISGNKNSATQNINQADFSSKIH